MRQQHTRRRVAGRAFLSAAMVAGALAGTAASAHAEATLTYAGGCTVAYVTTPPSSCSFVSTGHTVELAFEGTGTITVSGCQATTAYGPGAHTLSGQTAGATCTVAINGSGLASVLDETATDYAFQCGGFNAGAGDTSCAYVANTGQGLAEAVVVTAFSTTATVTVTDETTGLQVISCPVSGVGVIEDACTYPDTPGHAYLAGVSAPFASGAVFVAGG